MEKIYCGLLLVVLYINLSDGAYKLQERYSWTQLDFAFPNQRIKDQAIASGDYIPTNGLPVGIEHWGNKLFVTIPRWRDGIPATLTYINMDHTLSGSPELIPYPDWRTNTAGDCANGLSSVYRIKADQCGRLWLLDTGTLGIGNTTTNPCPYAVNVFDLATNTRIRRYELRPEDTNPNTFIANIAIDIGKNCDDAFAYMSDELGYGLIAYSWEQNKSWRFTHSFFLPDPLRGDFNVAGINYQWGEEGIFGMALSQIKSDGFRTMYFSPLASHREFVVSTRILRDESRVEDSFHDYQYLEERSGNAHTTARVLSDDGIMLFNLIDQNAVGCWHSSMPYTPQFHGIVDRDDVGLVFPVDVKIDENKDVWVMSDRMPVFLMAELDYTDINFRIYTAPLSTLIENTVCDLRTNIFGPPNTVAISSKDEESTIKPQQPFRHHPGHHHHFKYDSPPRSLVYTTQTQKVPIAHIPKAFVFNQHNGISYETGTGTSPHDYTTSGVRNIQSTGKTTNWWGGQTSPQWNQ